jgi:hypothetical protein
MEKDQMQFKEHKENISYKTNLSILIEILSGKHICISYSTGI